MTADSRKQFLAVPVSNTADVYKISIRFKKGNNNNQKSQLPFLEFEDIQLFKKNNQVVVHGEEEEGKEAGGCNCKNNFI